MDTQTHAELTISPMAGDLSASVTGLDLRHPLPQPTLGALRAAWAKHPVLCFPGQPLSLDELEQFTLQIGPFGDDPFIKPMPGHPNVLELRREKDETAKNFGAGWHSDWSFQAQPPAATILHGAVIPPVGGDTLFADCQRAYETLSDAMKKVLLPLRAVHSARQAYGRNGVYATGDEQRAMEIVTGAEAEETQSHPIVVSHPVSGKPALFVNPVYTVGIEGMTYEEGMSILGYLFRHISDEKFVYRHRWAEQSLVMWDNRCTLHYADGGYDGHLRVMHRTTVAGDTPVATITAARADRWAM